MASAPCSQSWAACWRLFTGPASTSIPANFSFISFRKEIALASTPSSVFRCSRSAPASTMAFTRSQPSSSCGLAAAATMSCLLASREAFGFLCTCFMSPRQISATSSMSLLTTGSLETFCCCSAVQACFKVTGSCARTTSRFMTAPRDAVLGLPSRSRLVTRPTRRPPMRPFSVMGMPLQPSSAWMRRASSTRCRGAKHAGFRMKPELYIFTL
mmetsp:Transcript_78796/g.189079  ORF Transcript_78796/g.189079 Transcript_78796/m.189079 type:complete len:213 (-) Transcript_78796:230-868(-)